MPVMNDPDSVKAQYSDDGNLSARIRLHVRHSTNKQGFPPWLFGKYAFGPGFRILELDCGNASQWEGNLERLPAGCTLVLTDLSMGMVGAVWEKFSGYRNMLAQRVDILGIPFPDHCFDAVIANHIDPRIDAYDAEFSFSLQSGGELLRRHFGEVRRFDYEDSLCVTQTRDLIDWIGSTATIANLASADFEGLYEYFEAIRVREGAIRIPKESGLFVSVK